MRDFFYEYKTDPFYVGTMPMLTAKPHLHKELELIYVVKGETVAWADRKSYMLKSGDLFLCFPNQIHYYSSTEYGEYFLIIPNAGIIYGMNDIFYDNIPAFNAITPERKSDLDELIKKFNSTQGMFKDTFTVGLINQFFGLIMPEFECKPHIKSDNSTLKAILNYCSRNFTENITLDDVSESLHLSKYHISHLFNEKLNVSFNMYINMLRVDLACDLLEDTNKKIADISEDTGFGSIRSFNRAFFRIMNSTPVQYRNACK